jgi:type I restriction enzyme S subunit
VARKTLNLEDVRRFRLPIPPIGEQVRIVTEISRQFSVLDASALVVDAACVRSAALRRSLLKAAFEGRLVPQDPSDEPASVLLERIRAQRAASSGSGGVRRRKKVEAS